MDITQRNNSKLQLKDSSWIHFVAIGGTGMGALAGLYKSMGHRVTGSDGPLYPPMSTFLEAQKIPLKAIFSPDNLKGATWSMNQEYPDLVIIGNAISKTNVEALEVERLIAENKTIRMSFPQALGETLIEGRKSFVVAGTHGKTTTTSLLAWAFEVLGQAPGFFIGGIPKNFECGSRPGLPKVFVSEGDEYDTAYWDKESKFLHYRPTWVVGTGIEFDHADIYSSVEQIEESFLKLTRITSDGWLLIDNLSAPRASSVERVAQELRKHSKTLLRYGEDSASDYQLVSSERVPLPWNPRAFGLKFVIKVLGKTTESFVTPMVGKHNLLNAVGVFGVLHASGFLPKAQDYQEVLKTFKGVARRQDLLFESDKRVVIDDFAHHPTAIRETLAALRERYPHYSVAAFFEPRSATSARNMLYADFVKCFGSADAVFLQEATKQNVPEAERLKVSDLMREIVGREHTDFAISKKSVEELLVEFDLWSSKKERVLAVVMSNGAFGGLARSLAGVKI